jgi:hypothetical protein
MNPDARATPTTRAAIMTTPDAMKKTADGIPGS